MYDNRNEIELDRNEVELDEIGQLLLAALALMVPVVTLVLVLAG